uniref:Uncharacterized protein n=1 Tax=Anguilla anguilla TaxID=7936 RepID=A0A0E9RPX7_ANGAN
MQMQKHVPLRTNSQCFFFCLVMETCSFQ